MQIIGEGRSWWINIQNLHPYEEGADILDVSICQINRHVINKLTNFDFTANRVGRCVEKIRIQARGFKVAQFNTKFWIHAFFFSVHFFRTYYKYECYLFFRKLQRIHSFTMNVLRNANSIAFFSKAKRCRKNKMLPLLPEEMT